MSKEIYNLCEKAVIIIRVRIFICSRENLDPSGMTSDVKIWEALEKCHIKEVIETTGGLGIHVKENGTSFSVGQRQLICLARAIIKSSKVYYLFTLRNMTRDHEIW